MKKKMKKSPCKKARLTIGFNFEREYTEELKKELDDLIPVLEKLIWDNIGARQPRTVFWHDEWWENKYYGWMMYGGQRMFYASDKELEVIKRKMKDDLKEVGRVMDNDYLKEMKMVFGVVRKWDREWKKLH
ncbi:hypothetical protein FWD07_02185 [Candidatus Saccharibacteria bacterium]|nr:hypothetical protein [Candidatus Saccharibacteria bacterium]